MTLNFKMFKRFFFFFFFLRVGLYARACVYARVCVCIRACVQACVNESVRIFGNNNLICNNRYII